MDRDRARQLLSELINAETGRFKRELTVSLGTSDVSLAKRKDMREAVRVADLFALALRVVRGEAGAEVADLLSFRHTFKRMARDAGLTEEVSDALNGHVGGGNVGRDYGGGFGLKALAEAMRKIDAPGSVQALPRWEPASGGVAGGSASRVPKVRRKD